MDTCLCQSFFAKASTVAEAMVDETHDRLRRGGRMDSAKIPLFIQEFAGAGFAPAPAFRSNG